MISVTLFICENKNNLGNLPVMVIFISWWKSLCRNALVQLLVQVHGFSRSSSLILIDSDHIGKSNFSPRKLQILCSRGYQLSFLSCKTVRWPGNDLCKASFAAPRNSRAYMSWINSIFLTWVILQKCSTGKIMTISRLTWN